MNNLDPLDQILKDIAVVLGLILKILRIYVASVKVNRQQKKCGINYDKLNSNEQETINPSKKIQENLHSEEPEPSLI